MKSFYIETNDLLSFNKVLRFYYVEDQNGDVTFNKVIDPKTEEEVPLESNPDLLLHIKSAYLANYERVYSNPSIS
jgi:hypothetical protein